MPSLALHPREAGVAVRGRAREWGLGRPTGLMGRKKLPLGAAAAVGKLCFRGTARLRPGPGHERWRMSRTDCPLARQGRFTYQ